MLADATGGHRVLATVFVECGASYRTGVPAELASVGETAFVEAAARAAADGPCRIVAAIVGHVDLALGDAAGAALDAHLEVSPERFRSVRNSSVYQPDPSARGSLAAPPPGLLADAGFRRGFACLAARGLLFDAWMYHTQLDELAALADAFPDTVMVLNHVGGPLGIGLYAGRREAVFADWRAGKARLAQRGNVRVKLGGMGMRLFGFDFPLAADPSSSEALADAWAPYMEACIELFGTSRCMFESNFPVDRGSCAYGVLWNAFKRIARPFSSTERHALFVGTAADTYRIAMLGT